VALSLLARITGDPIITARTRQSVFRNLAIRWIDIHRRRVFKIINYDVLLIN